MNHSVKALITVFVLGLIAVASSWYVNNKSGTTVDTSTWQTYRNDEIGYEIKYPAGFEITTYDQVDKDKLVEADSKSVLVVVRRSSDENQVITIGVYEYSDGVAMSDKKPETNGTFAGKPAHVGYRDVEYQIGVPLESFEVFLRYGKGEDKTVDQIVSTFKFTKSDVSTADTPTWQTYTNAKYGYEVKYPKQFKSDNGKVYNWVVKEDGNDTMISTDFPGEGPWFDVSYHSGSVDNIVKSYKDVEGGTIESNNPTVFAGRDARKLSVSSEFGATYEVILIPVSGGVLAVSSTNEEILATFKFTK
jgi:hypothetical protein